MMNVVKFANKAHEMLIKKRKNVSSNLSTSF